MKIGIRIRYLRKLKQLSQEKLALDVGLNPAFLGHIERGLKCPTVDTLSKIANALNVSLFELVNIDENVNENNDALANISFTVKKSFFRGYRAHSTYTI